MKYFKSIKFFIAGLVILNQIFFSIFFPTIVLAQADDFSDYSQDWGSVLEGLDISFLNEQTPDAQADFASYDGEGEGASGYFEPSAIEVKNSCEYSGKNSFEWAPSLHASYYNIWRVGSTPDPSRHGLLGTYFDNGDFSRPITSQIDLTNQAFDFNWGLGAPDNNKQVNPENFGVRWTGKIKAPSDGNYVFYISGTYGNGALWIDGKKKADVGGSSFNASGQISLEANKFYNIRVDYTNDKNDASVKLMWEGPGLVGTTPVSSIYLYPSYSNDLFPELIKSVFTPPKSPLFYNNSLYAEFYDGIKVSGDQPALITSLNEPTGVGTNKNAIDSTNTDIYSTWPPDPSINSNKFSARWLGKIKPTTKSKYRFRVSAKDGVKLWIYDFRNATQIIKDWPATPNSAMRNISGDTTVELEANTYYDFKMEFYYDGTFGTQDSTVKLEWQTIDSSGIAINPIPTSTTVPITAFVRDINPDLRTYSTTTTPTSGLYGFYYDGDQLGKNFVASKVEAGNSQGLFSFGNINQISPPPDTPLPPPGLLLSPNSFSIKWTGFIKTPQATTTNPTPNYTFYIDTTGSTGLTINGKTVIPVGGPTSYNTTPYTFSGNIALSRNRKYKIEVDYVANPGVLDKTFRFRWNYPTSDTNSVSETVPISALYSSDALPISVGQVAGLATKIYDNKTLNAQVYSRFDDIVNYSVTAGNIPPNQEDPVLINNLIKNDTYSLYWTGRIKPLNSTSYTFSMSSKDGSKLTLGKPGFPAKWINNWQDTTAANPTWSSSKTTSLTNELSVDLNFQYYFNNNFTRSPNPYFNLGITPAGSYNFSRPRINAIEETLSTDDTPLSTDEPYMYQIQAIGSGGQTSSYWFSPELYNCPGDPILSPSGGLNVSQGAGTSTTFPENYGLSGNLSTSSGNNKLNPIDISVNADTTDSLTPVEEFYVAFYNKKKSDGSDNPVINPASPGINYLPAVQAFLNQDSKNGFLLAYKIGQANSASSTCSPTINTPTITTTSTSNCYYVWDPNSGASGAWTQLSASIQKDICPYGISSCPNSQLYSVLHNNQPASWKVTFNSSFTSKNMYTGVFIRNANDFAFSPNAQACNTNNPSECTPP